MGFRVLVPPTLRPTVGVNGAQHRGVLLMGGGLLLMVGGDVYRGGGVLFMEGGRGCEWRSLFVFTHKPRVDHPLYGS